MVASGELFVGSKASLVCFLRMESSDMMACHPGCVARGGENQKLAKT